MPSGSLLAYVTVLMASRDNLNMFLGAFWLHGQSITSGLLYISGFKPFL